MMAALLSVMFWLHRPTLGGGEDASSIFISVSARRRLVRSLAVWRECNVTALPVRASKEARLYVNTHQSLFN